MPWFTGWACPWLAVGRHHDGSPWIAPTFFLGLQPADPIFITLTIPGHFYLVRAVPGAVPTAAASMDGSDGRTDGIPGAGKG